MKEKLVILGYSGHAYTVIEAAKSSGIDITGYFDIKESTTNPYGLEYLGNEGHFNNWNSLLNTHIFPAIGENKIREKLMNFCDNNDLNCPNIIHSDAWVSPTAKFDSGTLISATSVVNAMTQIGKGCIINTGALVEHDCRIGDFAHIGPRSVLAGNVTIGKRTLVGANAVLIPGINVGNDVTIGAGTVVLKDVPDGATIVGNPGKIITNG